MRHLHRYPTTRLITAEDRGWQAADGSATRERPKGHTASLDEATRRSARRTKHGGIVGDRTHLTPTEGAADHAAYIWRSRESGRSRIQSPRKLRIYNSLNESGIEIPFPTRTVYMKAIAG